MGKVLRMTDRVKLKVGDITFTIAPLNQLHKIEISECTKVTKGGEEIFDLIRAQTLLIKYGLKDIEGVEDADGEPYKLEFEGDCLTDDCVSEVFTIDGKSEFLTAAWQTLNGVPDKLVDPVSGKKLKGVALELVTKKKVPG